MKNTDFMNLSLPEGTDKIDIEILNSDFTAIENLLEQHAIIETMTLNGEGVIIGAIGPYIRLQNIDTVQVSIDIGKETYTLASGENVIIRETAENIGIITSGDVNITYFVNSKTYADKEFYTKEKVDELLSNVEATVEVDAELSETSENPVQNKVITAELASYATTAEVENKVTEKVAELVAGAPEDFDTLKELTDWLTEHEDSAASMNSAIQKNAEDIAKKLDADGTATKIKTLKGSSNTNRSVIFGDDSNKTNAGNTIPCIDPDFHFNPVTKLLTVPNIEANNILKYGLITLYVDSVNGSDSNTGTSTSSKLQTIEKAFEISKLYQRVRIYLADGEYGNSQDEYTFYEQLSIIGTSKEGTVLKTKLKAIDGTLTVSTLTHDTTGISQDIYPITASYNSCLRIYKCVLKSTGLACVRNEYHSRAYISDSDFATASQYTIGNVYQSNVSISDCTNSSGLKINAYKGGIIDIYGSEIECKYNDSSAVVYKDGVQINPVDISALLARIEALETATSTTTEGGE